MRERSLCHSSDFDFPLQPNFKSIPADYDKLDQALPHDFDNKSNIFLKLIQFASSPSCTLEEINSLCEIPSGIINDLDKYQGAAPLHYASMNGNLPIVAFLLEKGADVNILDKDKNATPITCAAAYGHLEIVKILLEHNSDLTINSGENSLLLWAVRRNHSEVVLCLLNHFACKDLDFPESGTLLRAAVISGSPEILEMIMQTGDTYTINNYSNIDRFEKTPLHLAATSHNAEIVKLLMSHGANVNATDEDGRTPLFYLMSDANKAIICLEIFMGCGKCDVNHQDNMGYAALHFAAIHRSSRAAEILLMNGADFSIRENDGNAALSMLKHNIPETGCLLRNVFDHAVTSTKYQNFPHQTRLDSNIKINFECVLPVPILPNRPIENEPRLKSCGDCCPNIFPCIKNTRSSNREETAKILCLVAEDEAALLLHPVIQSFLELKWQKTKYFLIPTLTFKAILMILFSVYVQVPYYVNQREYFPNGTSKLKIKLEEGERTPKLFKRLYAILLTMAIMRGLMIIVKILRAPKPQLRTLHPWISFAVLLIMTIYMRPKSWKMSTNPLQQSMAALAILLVWIDIWIDMGRFPRLGLSIRVFLRVFKTFTSFVLPHFCLFAGFALSLPLLFPRNGEMHSISMSITRLVRTMAGDITHVSDGVKLFTSESSPDEIYSHIILDYVYTTYVLLASIVLMNLLIGLAVNDIQRIYAEASVDKLVRQTILLNTLETSFKWIHSWIPRDFFGKYINLFDSSNEKIAFYFSAFLFYSKIISFRPKDMRSFSGDLKSAFLNITSSDNPQEKVFSHALPKIRNSGVSSRKSDSLRMDNSKYEMDLDDERLVIEKINELVLGFVENDND